MAQLRVDAVAMVDGPADRVLAALSDYQEFRPQLLTENFADYRVDAGGLGAGTEVRWTLRLGGHRERRRGRWPAWDCLVRVAELVEDGSDGGRIVERDSGSGLTTTWTVHPTDNGRSAVRVRADWEGPDGFTKGLTRAGQRLAVRNVYEGMLTKLHELFQPPAGD